MKEQKGKFYKRVLLGLLWPVLIFILISIVSISFLLIQLDESGNDARRITFSKQKNIISSTFLSIQNTVSELKNYTVDAWIDSEDDNFRYFYAAQIYRMLSKMGGTLDQTPISISLIVDFQNPMVLSSNGTSDLDWYFENNTNLDSDQSQRIATLLKIRDKSSITLPVYSENALTDLYTIIPYDTENGGRMLIVARVYIESLIDLDQKEQALLVFGNTIIPYWNTEESKSLIDDNKDRILSYDFTADNKDSFITVLSNPLIQYIAIFSDGPSVAIWIAIAIILSLLLLAVGTAIVLIQTKHIYEPVSEVISTDIDKNDDEFDEFEIIKERSREIKELSNELKRVLEERDQLASTRKMRLLLEGETVNPEDNDTIKYIVALVQFSDAERGVDVQYFQLTLEEKGIIYVPYSFNRFAIIYEDMECKEARVELEQILAEISDEASFNAAISDAYIGKQNLRKAYQQCLHLMDFTTSLRTYRIITPSDIPSQITDFYHYSAQSEARLISLVVTGVPQAKNEYDKIVDENIQDETLSEKTKLEFAYCMVFTIQRIFSELNKSPKALIGRDINFTSLLRIQSYKTLLSEIRDIIYQIVDNTHSLSSESDAQLLMMMKKYIHEKYMYDIGLQDLADCFNITPKYCGMLFSKLSNDTFKNYLNNYRIEEAKEIIKDNPSIKVSELSQRVGFNSSTSFIRVFSKYTGMTPKTFADLEAKKKQDSIF